MNFIKETARIIAEKSIILRKILRSIYNFYKRLVYKITTIGLKVDNKLIVFCAFNGKSYACSPKAIYKYIQSSPEYKDYKLVWSFENVEKYKELEKNENTLIVKHNSKEYRKYLAKAKYWIFNYKIPDYLYPKKNQVFVQCWHGTPLKRLRVRFDPLR